MAMPSKSWTSRLIRVCTASTFKCCKLSLVPSSTCQLTVFRFLYPPILGSTNNPSQSNDFTLAWQSEGVVDSSVFEIEEQYLDANDGQVLTSTSTSYEFFRFEQKLPGLIGYRVRHCHPDSAECSGWSLTAWQTIVGSATTPAEAALFSIGDIALRNCLAEQIHSTTSSIGSGVLVGEIAAMYCDDRDIYDLTNLGLFPNLTTVHLNRNNIDNLTPLAPILSRGVDSPQQIRYDLRLAENQLTSNSLLDFQLPEVKFSTLDLSRNSLISLDGLSSMVQADDLYLSENVIHSLAPIEGVLLDRLFAEQNNLTELNDLQVSHTLQLNNNTIYDFGTLLQLPASLQNLSLSANPIAADPSHQQVLASAGDLKHLALDGTGISSAGFLNSLQDLETLSVRENQIGEISVSSSLINLRELWGSANPITSIAPLTQLPALELLDLENTNLQSIPAFDQTSVLSDLIITHGSFDTENALDGFENAHALERLRLAENEIVDILALLVLLSNDSGNVALGQGQYPEVYVDVSGEPLIACSQIEFALTGFPERIWHNDAYPRKCMPDAPDFAAVSDSTRNRLGLSWPPLAIPEGYDGVQSVEAQYKLSQQTEWLVYDTRSFGGCNRT